MKKWVIVGTAAVLVAVGGGWYAEQLIYQKVGNHIEDMLQDPSVQQQVEHAAGDPRVVAKLTDAANHLKDQSASGGRGADSPTSSTPRGSPGDPEGGAAAASADAAGTIGRAGSAAGTSPQPSSGPAAAGGTSGQSSGPLVFHSRSEAIQFAMSRFSPAEIARYMSMYLRGMTPEEKRAAKADVLARFSPAEIRALIAASKLPN
ncbi:MAG: hypothetical protein QJR01_08195 [Kyrpidia sp.]|nr:hypothetical protein [Kyrpidia sp.]